MTSLPVSPFSLTGPTLPGPLRIVEPLTSQRIACPETPHAAPNPRSAAVCIHNLTMLLPPPSRLPPLLSPPQGTFTDDAVIVSLGVYCGNFESDDQRAFLSVVYVYSKRHLYSRPPTEGCEIYAATYLGPTSWYSTAHFALLAFSLQPPLFPTISLFPYNLPFSPFSGFSSVVCLRKGKAAAGITPPTWPSQSFDRACVMTVISSYKCMCTRTLHLRAAPCSYITLQVPLRATQWAGPGGKLLQALQQLHPAGTTTGYRGCG